MRRLSLLLVALALCVMPLAAAASPDAAPDHPTYATDTGPLLQSTKTVALGLGLLSALLGVLLYVVPQRAAAATKERTEATLRERILTLQEEDRRRIARELHDGAGQALTAARLQLVALRAAGTAPPTVVEEIIARVDDAIEEVRRSTTALAPPALAELGLLGALGRHCQTFAGASGLQVRLDAPRSLPPLPSYIEIAVYRIVQEALTNAARHAGASLAWIRLSAADGRVQLEIGDDGTGLAGPTDGGFGLDSIGDRARLAGGKMELLGRRGPGTRLRVTMPTPTMAGG